MKHWLIGIACALILASTAAVAGDTWKTVVDLDGRQARTQETNLGNFVADAIRQATDADIALVHARAFGDDSLIRAGVIDEQMLRERVKIATSPVVVLTIGPAVLREIMERSLSKAPEANTAFLQISGMEVIYDSSKAQRSRVQSITVKGKQLDFLDAKTTFTVAMPRELGIGGAGYLQVFPDQVLNSMATPDITVLTAMKTYITEQKGEISTKVDERLKDLHAKE